MEPKTIVIVGGGHAGAQAVDSLRREHFSGRIVLLADENELPYQRPPLSKKYLAGEMTLDRLFFKHRDFYSEHAVELKLGIRAQKLDAVRRTLELSNGETLGYDRLLLALGARPRLLTCLGENLNRVHALRTVADVDAIKKAIFPGMRIVIIGGGYIGLETAATCSALNCEVTILEMADRVMNRVVAPVVSDFFAEQHRERGVRIICNARVDRLEGTDTVEKVVCDDGVEYPADLVVFGVGAIPNVELARDAGLACDNGIWVDQYCRTDAADIYAAGDCCNQLSLHFGRRVRLESVDNAFEQAKTAVLNMLGKTTVHDKVPWFWSDQFDLKLLIVGLSQDHDRVIVRGEPGSRSFSVCYLRDKELLAVDAINHAKDYMAARKLIADRTAMDVRLVADPAIALKDAVSA